MRDQIFGLFFRFRDLLSGQAGQDLVEYSMVVSMIALGAVVAMQSVDVAIAQVFNTISSTIDGALHSVS